MAEVKDTLKAMGIAKAALDERYRYHELYLSLKCPICDDGVINCAKSVGNKHTHGKCTTSGCVSWIE